MKVHVLHRTASGYARESSDVSVVVAVLSDYNLAQKIAVSEHCAVTTLELDQLALGILDRAQALGIDASGLYNA